jgi:pyruvate/2-oxoglutarate dehydrogenase complex dihydrolipoamide acyltransferase (E2) component
MIAFSRQCMGQALAFAAHCSSHVLDVLQDDGFVAKILVPEGEKDIAVGTPLLVLVEDADSVAAFKDFSPSSGDKGVAAAAEPAEADAPPKQEEGEAAGRRAQSRPSSFALPPITPVKCLSSATAAGHLSRSLEGFMPARKEEAGITARLNTMCACWAQLRPAKAAAAAVRADTSTTR